ncbi:hypothetical protein E2562_026279 [Oryza meyeriana var. granulata]|uniref:Plant heme peroxidase family profile domain-containing protein n=1 Tax=Oryza meyeriana var. granulata TaxID=110450 RepID=A0A6G1CHS0_9ORYZ|nr:hypothetical protein E2562_026279 [Oryza meyeriana var. granulata]
MPAGVAAGLSAEYYKATCPRLESIVRYEVSRKINETVVTIPAVLRLFFHDCLVTLWNWNHYLSSLNPEATPFPTVQSCNLLLLSSGSFGALWLYTVLTPSSSLAIFSLK